METTVPLENGESRSAEPPRRPRRGRPLRWLLRVASIVALVYGAGYVTLRVSGTVMVTDEHSFPGHTGHVAVSINGSGIVEALRAAGVSESVIFTVYWPLVELECRGRDAFSSR